MRPSFVTWFETKRPTMDEREIIADAMMHSVATQMGTYTKKTAGRKRLGEVVQGGAKKARVANF